MKKLLFLTLLLTLFSNSVIAQLGQPIEPKSPDTLMIQYLSKVNGESTDIYAKSFVSQLNQDSTIGYELFYTKSNDKTRFLLKVYGLNRFNVLDIVRKSFSDAYYVDDRGWAVKY